MNISRFFIDRPIFAAVISVVITIIGIAAYPLLPPAQYPEIAPPTITINAAYPGASAQTLEDSVLSVIEREMNGAPGMAYMESVAQANGTGQITLSFEPGTNLDLAQVEVQNRLSRATPRLPSVVNQQGVRIEKSQSNFLMFTMLSSSEPGADVTRIADYAARNVQPELQRLPGVGQVQLFGAERAMRGEIALSFGDVSLLTALPVLTQTRDGGVLKLEWTTGDGGVFPMPVEVEIDGGVLGAHRNEIVDA